MVGGNAIVDDLHLDDPSPFPGMDPFLEHSDVFPDLHDSLIAYIREAVQAKLPAPYFARMGSRVWFDFARRQIGPDVPVRRTKGAQSNGGNGTPGNEEGGGLAVATRTQPLIVTIPQDEFREPFLEIRRIENELQRLVTVIEILSLANKTPGEKGRKLYKRKQREILDSETHLVEVDLLCDGTHATAIPLDELEGLGREIDYHVCVHRFDNLEDYFIYPVALNESLPEIAIPLLPDDGAVSLDLQQVFDRSYDAAYYRRSVRYRDAQVVLPLPEKWRKWAADVVATVRAE